MNFWNDWHDKATGEQTDSQRRAESHRRHERSEKTENQQDKLHARGDEQAHDAGHGYDPASINQRDHWSSWDHKKMKTMVDDINTESITGKGADWQKFGGNLSTSFQQFHTEVTGAVKGGWTGDAATAAATAPDGMAKWGKSMGAASDGTGTRIQQASTAAKQAQINMPEPEDFSWRRTLVNGAGGLLTGGLGGGIASGGKDAYEQHKEMQQAKQKAVDVMNRMYTQGYVDVDNTTPAFAAPDDDGNGPKPPITTWPPPPPPGKWPPTPPDQRRGGDDDTGSGRDTGGDQDGRTGDPRTPGATDPSRSHDGGDTGSTGNDGGWNGPGRTDPSNTYPTGRGGPHGTGVDPRGPGAHPTTGGAGGMGMPMMGGGGMGGAGGDNEYSRRGYGRGGGSGMGESGAGGRSGIGGSAAQEAMGGRGGAGRGGPMGGGRGGRKEEDTEHETADYLVETDDVFGSGEMVAPPVIGES